MSETSPSKYVLSIEFLDGKRTVIYTDFMYIRKEPHINKSYLFVEGNKIISLFNGVAQIGNQRMSWYNNCQLLDLGTAYIDSELEYTTPMITRLEVYVNV